VTRAVNEWVADHDDQAIPPRVQLRVWERDGGVCQCGCGIKINGKPWQLDHRVALINGGSHRESNLQVMLTAHHADKTRADVREKSTVRRKRAKHIGIRKAKRLIPGSKGSGIRKPINGPAYRVSE
jgi:5-methylcytosine-specific restriction enzyme A